MACSNHFDDAHNWDNIDANSINFPNCTRRIANNWPALAVSALAEAADLFLVAY